MTPAIFSPAGLTLSAEERAFFRDAEPAGYILFGRNVSDRQQLRALTDDLRGLHGRDRLLISIDQEGGRVARMKPPVWDAYPTGQAFADLWQVAPSSAIEAARCNGALLGLDLAEAGITVDYTPLLDVRQPGAHDVIGDRALGTDPLQVAALGRAVLDGLAAAGVAGCIKHMPGHGRAGADSHKELPTVTANAAELELDLAPFRTLATRARIGMTAHVRYTAWDDAVPGTLSPFVVQTIIREAIGFAGLLLSDDLDMQALSGSVPERALAAHRAGCDLALNCWARMDDMIGMAELLPPMDEARLARLDAALAVADMAEPLDRPGLLASRDALLRIAA
ncbi:beta-N-acetylhexosaminidase [Croceibacterium ferulae]|uniref:beta-N-acetylhexosaminidase n=1 Tax=Croceibacterium ferulae TaxID=1854641 RepID=UPI000EB08430|nr:beta-N-acetylhexosaminidase [Croceibacterium ferulae]